MKSQSQSLVRIKVGVANPQSKCRRIARRPQRQVPGCFGAERDSGVAGIEVEAHCRLNAMNRHAEIDGAAAIRVRTAEK